MVIHPRTAAAPPGVSILLSISTRPAAQPQLANRKAPSYSYEVLDAARHRESSGSLLAPAGGDGGLFLPLPVQGLPAGVHTLVIHTGPSGEIVSRSRSQTSR